MLRTFLTMLMVCLVLWGLLIQAAEAKRFGGGRNFGVSRSSSSFSRAKPAPAFGQSYSRTPQSLGQNASPMSRWWGPIAGLITGGLIASLLMKNGLASGIMSLLLIAGLIFGLFLLINFFRHRQQPAMQSANPYQNDRNNFAQDTVTKFAPTNRSEPLMPTYPSDFDAPAFLRDAKVQFMRLQAAYDQKNVNDIREFTTPEVFAEIQMQLQERGNEENKTNIMNLAAELLQVENNTPQGENIGTTLIASVHFTAMIEENNAAAIHVEEIWYFKKESNHTRWLVAGVQQA